MIIILYYIIKGAQQSVEGQTLTPCMDTPLDIYIAYTGMYCNIIWALNITAIVFERVVMYNIIIIILL